MHEQAHCLECDWTADGPGSDRAAHLHTTSKARGHIRHATVTASHGSDECGPDCRATSSPGTRGGHPTTRKAPNDE